MAAVVHINFRVVYYHSEAWFLAYAGTGRNASTILSHVHAWHPLLMAVLSLEMVMLASALLSASVLASTPSLASAFGDCVGGDPDSIVAMAAVSALAFAAAFVSV